MIELEVLVRELKKREIRIAPNTEGQLVIDSPPGALTPNLIEGLKFYRPEILAGLRAAMESLPLPPDARRIWDKALDLAGAESPLSIEMMIALRKADVKWG